jgi:hypothetical protein
MANKFSKFYKAPPSPKGMKRPEGAGNFDNMDDYNIVDSIDVNTINCVEDATISGGLLVKQNISGSQLYLDDNLISNRVLSVWQPTIQSWASDYSAFQIGWSAGMMSKNTGNNLWMMQNMYWDGTNFRRISTSTGTIWRLDSGNCIFYSISSGAADSIVNPLATAIFNLRADGELQLPITGIAAGLLIGGDARLYRAGANRLATEDQFEIIRASLIPNLVLNHTGEASAKSSVVFQDDSVDKMAIFYDIGATGAHDVSIWDTGTGTIATFDGATGQLKLPITGSSAGLLIGGDALWYRSAANVMRTPDSLVVDGTITQAGSTLDATYIQRGGGNINEDTYFNNKNIKTVQDISLQTISWATVQLSAGANVLNLASGDSFSVIDGNISVGGTGTSGNIENVKAKMTSTGGYAVKLTNQQGHVISGGNLVKADAANDDSVVLTAAGDVECLGVVLDSTVADGAEGWIVVAGIADVAHDENVAAVRGNWVSTGVLAGYAATAASPAAAPTHFEEIGHCIESVSAGGAETHILARCVLHFN